MTLSEIIALVSRWWLDDWQSAGVPFAGFVTMLLLVVVVADHTSSFSIAEILFILLIPPVTLLVALHWPYLIWLVAGLWWWHRTHPEQQLI